MAWAHEGTREWFTKCSRNPAESWNSTLEPRIVFRTQEIGNRHRTQSPSTYGWQAGGKPLIANPEQCCQCIYIVLHAHSTQVWGFVSWKSRSALWNQLIVVCKRTNDPIPKFNPRPVRSRFWISRLALALLSDSAAYTCRLSRNFFYYLWDH